MNHCLVFGARGHLAQTRIIPALNKLECPYTPISRSVVSNLQHLENTSNVVAYMSIPTHNFCENVEPYMNVVNPTYILEKPHGHSLEDFERIQSFVKTNDLNVLYSDHYLGKSILDRIELPDNLEKIKITLHESPDINQRIEYFDSVGIILDMYQSHCVLLFATLLARHFKQTRKEILHDFKFVKPHVTHISKSDLYVGTAPTSCRVSMKYKDIFLEADISKMVPDEKSISINDRDNYNMNTGRCAYETILEKIKMNDLSSCIDEQEVRDLWGHFSIMEC